MSHVVPLIMSGYVKIYGSILGSSVWAEAPTTRIVWITMLAMADATGKVEASVSGLARFANVTMAEARKALEALAAPDEDSKSKEYEGRRVKPTDGGWLILNYLKYREMRSAKQVAEALRKADYRARTTASDSGDMSQKSHGNGVAEEEAESVAVEASSTSSAKERFLSQVKRRESWEGELRMAMKGGGHGVHVTEDQVDAAFRDLEANGVDPTRAGLPVLRAYLKRIAAADAAPVSSAPRGPETDYEAIQRLKREAKD